MEDRVIDSITKQIEDLDKEIDNPESKNYHVNQFRSHVIQRLEGDDDDR